MRQTLFLIPLLLATPALGSQITLGPLFESVDLNVGDARTVTLEDGSTCAVKLIKIKEHRDPVRNALRGADVVVEVNGERKTLGCATYHLPVTVGGVRIDCPVVKGYLRAYKNVWALDRDARLRIWPKTGPFIRPGTFHYPVAQRWGAASTLFDNEIGDGELHGADRVYYHQGFDFGGADRMVPVHAATDGVVVSVRGQSMENVPECVRPRYDVLYLWDVARDWFYRYSHFDSINQDIELGDVVELGDRLGTLGKEGASGGWAHLHFELIRPQESGRYGSDSMYAFLHQVYQADNDEPVIAVARPQLLGEVGKPIVHDASRSWSKSGSEGMQYEWVFDDGTRKNGATVKHTYESGGRYRPVLKVTDAKGNVDYDFGKVTVADPNIPSAKRCYLHAAYWPTQNIRVGDPVTFLVRSFRFRPPVGDEVWDFGDGSPKVTTRSDGCVEHNNKSGYARVQHRFEKPGYYIVTVRRQNDNGQWAVDKLDVKVRP
ncbi:MAG: PKD domain-containing protein [bacterium]